MWQVIREELREQGLEVVAVAFDTAGSDAVADKIRCEDLDERPDVIRRLRGWSEDLWARKAPPAYPVLIDEQHAVADLFGMTNVPMAVWIDEEGRIVRPAEPAGVSDHFRRMDAATFGIPDDDAAALQATRELYLDALRDWVAEGADSAFALGEDEVVRRTRPRSDAEVRASAHARIARHLFREGERDAAQRHLEEAGRLAPDRWDLRRQGRVLDPEIVGTIDVSEEYFETQNARDGVAYYPQIDLPGVPPPPAWMQGEQR